jgi:hypothetical protein
MEIVQNCDSSIAALSTYAYRSLSIYDQSTQLIVIITFKYFQVELIHT